MIPPPKRAVTRFFVPLIDVLILLFCIFLLMPFVSRSDNNSPEPGIDHSNPASVEDLRQKIADLELKLEQARQTIERLNKEKTNPAAAMSVRVLEIDAATGKLFDFEPDGPEPRREIRDEADARRLSTRLKRMARGKEVFVLILYPRKLTGFPLLKQIESYHQWFRDVPHGFDNPWAPKESNREHE